MRSAETMEAMTQVQKIRVKPDVDAITTPEERALLEVLLELCDGNLDVETTEAEVRELSELYWDMYKAKPFVGLRELIEADVGVARFFEMFRCQVLPIREVSGRRKQVLEMYQKFVDSSGGYPQTPHLSALRTRAYNLVLFSLSYKVAVQTPQGKKPWKQ